MAAHFNFKKVPQVQPNQIPEYIIEDEIQSIASNDDEDKLMIVSDKSDNWLISLLLFIIRVFFLIYNWLSYLTQNYYLKYLININKLYYSNSH